VSCAWRCFGTLAIAGSGQLEAACWGAGVVATWALAAEAANRASNTENSAARAQMETTPETLP